MGNEDLADDPRRTAQCKSTAIRELMLGALKRGDRAVFADPSGDYLQLFYDPGRGDVILNPFDSRSARWDPFGEFSARFEVDQLVRSLIPTDGEWSGYARTFVSAVIARCADAGARDLDEAWRLIAIAPSHELQALLTGTAAQPFLEEGNVRMFGSIRAVAVSAMEALDYVRDQGGVPFSVRRWIREGRTYGQGEARTIVENCSNSLILRCSASEGGGTSEFASQLIGHARSLARRCRSRIPAGAFCRASRGR